MGMLDRFKGKGGETPSPALSSTNVDMENKRHVDAPLRIAQRFRPHVIFMAVLVSMGGFIFGSYSR
jgi:SP family sugar:H+ symporter-like MFS transporter